MGVTNCLLIGFRAHSTGGNICLHCKSAQAPMAGEHIGPRVESIAIILLNRHSISLPSKSTSLHSQIGTTLRSVRSIFFVQWMVVSAETHNRSECREYVPVEFSITNRTLRKRRQRDFKSQGLGKTDLKQ